MHSTLPSPSRSQKIGVVIPTFRRPDFARAAVLQWLAQTTKPDFIVVHQNGSTPSYDWCISDLAHEVETAIDWQHSPEKLKQHDWYAIPLQHLLDLGCTHFFWADHDDIYFTHHIARTMAELEHFDLSVAKHCGVLYLKPNDYRFHETVAFSSHAPGGMSSSMAFNAAFAMQLLQDIREHGDAHYYTDNIVAKVTMPKFRVFISEERQSTVYVAHAGAQSSNTWIDTVFARTKEG